MTAQEIVGQLNGFDVIAIGKDALDIPEYQVGDTKFRSVAVLLSNLEGFHEKWVTVEFRQFNEVPLGEFQQWINDTSSHLKGCRLVMGLSDDGSLNIPHVSISGWSEDLAEEEQAFFDDLAARTHFAS